MLVAAVDDFSRVDGVEVATTWDHRLGEHPFAKAQVWPVSLREEEICLFQRLAKECDAVLLIAPELGGELLRRARLVESLGGKLIGPSSAAIELCADKLALFEHLEQMGVSTISTQRLSPADGDMGRQGSRSRTQPFLYPIVVKPRHGAGSQEIQFLLAEDNFNEWRESRMRDRSSRSYGDFVIQPYIAGTAWSVAVIVSPTADRIELLPVAEQILSADGRFTYQGGRIPARLENQEELAKLARLACQSVPGLRGYVGVDLISPANGKPATVVEINPRFTTSYLGYRQATSENLARRMLTPEAVPAIVNWCSLPIEFNSFGMPSAR